MNSSSRPAVARAVPVANATAEAQPGPLLLSRPVASSIPLDWSQRIPALDGLRGIAILLVLLRHSVFGMETSSKFLSKLLAAGLLSWSGVDLFFVLSGFLIGGILLDARESPNYFKTFYLRRFYRIFPLYLTVTGLFFFRHLPFHLLPGAFGDFSPLPIPRFAYATLTQNFWMANLGWYGPTAMAVTWSLAVEEQFYLTIPFLIRKIRPARFVFVMLTIVAGAPALRYILSRSFVNGNFSCYVLMPCRADALCLGVLAAYLARRPKFWNLIAAHRGVLRGLTIFLLAGVAFMTYQQWDQFSHAMVTVGYSWLAVFYTCCLLLALGKGPGGKEGALCTSGLMKLGTLAYCSYLLHFPLVNAGRRVAAMLFPAAGNAGWLMGGVLGVALTLLIASLSWKYFEKPMLRRGHAYTY